MTNAKEFALLTEKIKQKGKAKAQRFRRYEKSETQCIQNKMFKDNIKEFYRHLGTKNIEAKESPSMAAGEPYWKSVWGEKAKHNETAERIGEEKSETTDPLCA